MLKVENLSFKYNKKLEEVVENVNFSLEQAGIYIILGQNGAGKTTVLKCIEGINNFKDGRIEIDGKDLKEYKRKELAKTISYVPQNFNKIQLTVYETIMLGRTSYITFKASKHDEEIVENLIKEFGLEKYAFRNFETLSGGEKQKVIIAMALAAEPKILLLDEPTSNLDIKNSLMIMNLIKDLVKTKNLTVLISMHDISLAYEFGDKFLFFKDKKIKYFLEKAEINEDILKETYDVDLKIENNHIHYVGGN